MNLMSKRSKILEIKFEKLHLTQRMLLGISKIGTDSKSLRSSWTSIHMKKTFTTQFWRLNFHLKPTIMIKHLST